MKITYLVGPYGVGKTTKVLELKNKFDAYILEDKAMLYFLKYPDPIIRNLFYISAYHYRIKLFMDNANKEDYSIISDGHPIQSMCYAITMNIYEDSELHVSKEQLNLVEQFHNNLASHINYDWEQEMILMLPDREEHLEMVKNRYKKRSNEFPEEIDERYLDILRSVMFLYLPYISKKIYGIETRIVGLDFKL